MAIIKPTPISGFPEWTPQEKIVENRLLDIIRAAYERFGFVPIETPAVERNETLTSKGGNEKEIYSLGRLAASEDEGSTTDFSLHFDLTVPLARFVAQRYGELAFPFRRYQIQKVWRGERPQAGRFREFYQCDIDIIGDGELGLLNDAEIPSIIYSIFKEMKIGRFLIRINNRKILQGLCQHFGIAQGEVNDVLTLIDKLEKIGTGRVLQGIAEISKAPLERVQELIDTISFECGNSEILSKLESMEVNDTFRKGVEELAFVFRNIKAFGVPDQYLSIDLRIARGLGYYTGTVYETILVDHPGVGSICSGGRYDDLASYFTDRKLPGVGISIGLTRMFSRLLKAKIVEAGPATVAPVIVTVMDHDRLQNYLRIAAKIREAGINTECILEKLPFKAQLKYANRKGFAFAVIAGEEEFGKGVYNVKNLGSGEQKTVSSVNEIIAIVKNLSE